MALQEETFPRPRIWAHWIPVTSTGMREVEAAPAAAPFCEAPADKAGQTPVGEVCLYTPGRKFGENANLTPPSSSGLTRGCMPRGCGLDARLKPEHNEGRGGRKEPFTASTPASRMPQALVKYFSKVALLLRYFTSCFQEPSATTRPPDPASREGVFAKRSRRPANLAA